MQDAQEDKEFDLKVSSRIASVQVEFWCKRVQLE